MTKFLNSPAVILIAATVLLIAILLVVFQPGKRVGHDSMTAAERAKQLAKEGKREQVITFSSGLIPLQEPSAGGAPTAANLFAIGVGQISLGEPEPIRRSSSYRGYGGVYGASGNMMIVVDDAPQTIFGPFNNVIIYDKRSGGVTKIFDERISVAGFKWMSRVVPRSIAILATSDDSNRDGKLTSTDIQHLFVYTLADRRLHRVTGLNASVEDVANVFDVDYLIVEASIDTDKNGEIARDSYDNKTVPEPQSLYRVDLGTFVATPLIDKTLFDELQGTLEGSRSGQAVPPTN